MKKIMLVLTMLSLLAGSCLASYTVTGTVQNKVTGQAVPYANVSLSCIGTPATTTADKFGSFKLTCSSDMSGMTVYLSASSGFLSGSRHWDVPENTYTQSRNVKIGLTIQADPSLDIHTMPAKWTGSGLTTVASPALIQPTSAPVQVQNAQVNMAFNGPIVGVDDVAAPVDSTDITITDWSVPVPGQLQVEVVVNPPRNIDFPAESFFDVFFEVDIPETDALAAQVTIEEATFNLGIDDLSGIPSQTDYLVGEPELCKPHFLLDSETEWDEGLVMEWPQPSIIPMTPAEWNDTDPNFGYLAQWQVPEWVEGEPYPPVEFLPPQLYVWEGGDDGNPENDPDPADAGLVMRWGDNDYDPPLNEGQDYGSAWKWDYGLDPDLSNSIITVTVTPPPGINNVSLGLQDINGLIRSWQWACGTAAVPSGVPTTITIDTTMTGIGAASPTATGYTSNPGFNLKQVQFIIADENGTWVGQQAAVPPGGNIAGIWNYWHNLSVTLKQPEGTANSKWYVKYSQPPVEIDDGMLDGWDQYSQYYTDQQQTIISMAADDWQCYDDRPVTDIHWWGSFIGWTQPYPPPASQLPDYFKICIWTDVPQNVVDPQGVQTPYSRPLKLLWEHDCYKWVWNFAAYDLDPRFQFSDYPEYDQPKLGDPQVNESCFQFTQLLDQDDWFWQEPMEVLADDTVVPNVYWISIAAVYNHTQPEYPWGWKTRPYDPALAPDTAAVITDVDIHPFVVNTTMVNGHFPLVLPDPDLYPGEKQYDLAFELTTNEPKCPGLKADLNDDCIVSLPDFAIMAKEWLATSP